jgi:hypothetical protein
MKKILIATLIAATAFPTAVQAAATSTNSGATCGKAAPGMKWIGQILNPGGGCK